MTPNSAYFELKQRYQRRFVFGVTALFLTFFGVLLIRFGLDNRGNSISVNGQAVFSGYANPYLLIIGYGLLSVILIHFFWVLSMENRLSHSQVNIGVHLALTLVSVSTLWVSIDSSAFHETYRANPFEVTPPLCLLPFAILVIITFIGHVPSWIYHEWLTRRLIQRDRMEKRKCDEWIETSTTIVGDDGELLYPIEMMSSEKRFM